MGRLSLGFRTLFVFLAVWCLLALSTPTRAEQALPLEIAELFPMSTDELLQLAESQSSFATDSPVPDLEQKLSQPVLPTLSAEDEFNENDYHSFAELSAQDQTIAELESEAGAAAEAAMRSSTMTDSEMEAEVDAAIQASTKARTHSQSQSKAESESESESETESESEAEAEAETENGAEQQPGALFQPPPVMGTPVVTPIPVDPSANANAVASSNTNNNNNAAATTTTTTTTPAAAVPALLPPTAPGTLPTTMIVNGQVVPISPARLRLEKARLEILDNERKIFNQSIIMRRDHNKPVMQTNDKSLSSGANYWERHMHELRSSEGVVATDKASLLTRDDARCVICQYVVQQAIGLLSGKPLTTGGATAGGKRAAAAAAAGEAAFLEFETSVDELEEEMDSVDMGDDADPFAFLELDASLGALDSMSLDAVLAAELESTVALNSAVDNFLSAADSAQEHSAEQALSSHYGRRPSARSLRAHRRRLPRGGGRDFGGRERRGFGRRAYAGQNLRNVRPVTYPVQLNDFGYEVNQRNRQADILAYRPRIQRVGRADLEKLQAKWDETRAQYQKLYTGVYAAFEKLCSKRMPLAYSGYCTEMMRDYRYIAQGIQYGDRSQSICMNGNWCDRQSYLRHAVHAYFIREAGDH